MKRLLLTLILALLGASAFSQNILTPQDDGFLSPYVGCGNYGKSVAVMGGSLSVNKESNAAKQLWANLLGMSVTTYGVGGAGFSSEQGHTLQQQVREAGVHDIYILWASTNDYMNNRECGEWTDYTEFDGYDESKLTTQCGGIKHILIVIIRIVRAFTLLID